MDADQKAAEEARRERHWDPAVRWRVLQDTIAWAEAQATARRNTRQSRLAEQQQKLARQQPPAAEPATDSTAEAQPQKPGV